MKGVHYPWMVQQTLSAGGLHLLTAPIFGAILGAFGALASRFKHPTPSPA
jgi:hypothetical protein